MEKSIRNELMEKLGIGKSEASKLISTYARNHDGKVNVKNIEADMDKIANNMIHEASNIYSDYDAKFEILYCGKDRQKDGIMSLLDDEEQSLALSYLSNRYYENVDTWAHTLYATAKNKLSKVLDGGIEDYRKFVDELPYKNISRVASTFDLESGFAEFLAKNGNTSDFKKFMTSIQPVRDEETELMEKYVSNYSGKLLRKSCPRDLSNKIFNQLQEDVKENEPIIFERARIMEGLGSIHHNKNLDKDKKEQLQDMYISQYLKGNVDKYFAKLARTINEESIDLLKEYLEMDKNTPWSEKENLLTRQALSATEQKMKESYKAFLSTLKERFKKDELTPENIVADLRASTLLLHEYDDICMVQDEATKKAQLKICTKHPIILGEDLNVVIDGTKLKEIIDYANNNSLNGANKKIEAIAKKGMGEVSVINTYITDGRNKFSSDHIIGYLSEEEDSPYVTGGKISDNSGLTDLQVKCPYYVVSDDMYLENNVATMTEEEIEQFNHKAEPVNVKVHDYRFGRVDGYYLRDVYDFKINGEQYHIKGDDWTNGGSYTVIWKGKEEKEDYPETAIGLCSSKSEWARNQSGVNKDAVIKFIAENPMRFSKYYDKYEKTSDCCGLYPTAHIERMCQDIMEMPTESKLRELKEQEEQKANEEFFEAVVDSATIKKDLTEKTEKAQDLLTEYKQLELNSENTISNK